MKIGVNPNIIISKDGNTALNVLTGEIHYIPEHERVRLLEICECSTELNSSDLYLLNIGILALEHHAESKKYQLQNLISDYLNQRAALCIMPTERCNFRCTYCYETFLKGRMSPQIVDGIIHFLQKNAPDFKFYSLAFFGGEPLLEADIIANISKKFRDIQQQHGFVGSVAITTNGSLLTRDMVTLLNLAKVDLYHISIDGPRELHNNQRVNLGGKDTYDLILNNIDYLLNTTDSQVIFRINQDTANHQSSQVIYNWLANEIIPRYERFGQRIRYHIVSIWNASTTAIDGLCISDTQRFQTWFDVKHNLAKLANKNVLSALAEEISGLGSLACYAGKPNHYVVGSDGAVYKCTVAFDLPENKVGIIETDGVMVLDKKKEEIWIGTNSLNDSTCSNCAFGVSCMGLHCPLTRLQIGKPPCPTEKEFISSYLSEVN